MKSEDFESICESIYDLTSAQRKGLSQLLQSRIWLYDSGGDCEFERINEFDNGAIKAILRETPMELLSYALKGVTESLLRRFSKNMTKSDAAKLARKMKALGPIRLSERDEAQGKILETIDRLAETGEIKPSFPLTSIPAEFAISGLSADGDPLRLQARVLLTLDDNVWKSLIGEIEAATLADFLWYLSDARLARNVFAFSSPHIAKVLMIDFQKRWMGVKLDNASDIQLEMGRKAMQKVLETLNQLADMGMIRIQNRSQ